MPAVHAEDRSTCNAVTSLSKRIQTTTAQRVSSGHIIHFHNSLNATKVCLAKSREAQEAAVHLQSKSPQCNFLKTKQNSLPLI
jgi:hypothetical protein